MTNWPSAWRLRDMHLLTCLHPRTPIPANTRLRNKHSGTRNAPLRTSMPTFATPLPTLPSRPDSSSPVRSLSARPTPMPLTPERLMRPTPSMSCLVRRRAVTPSDNAPLRPNFRKPVSPTRCLSYAAVCAAPVLRCTACLTLQTASCLTRLPVLHCTAAACQRYVLRGLLSYLT